MQKMRDVDETDRGSSVEPKERKSRYKRKKAAKLAYNTAQQQYFNFENPTKKPDLNMSQGIDIKVKILKSDRLQHRKMSQKNIPKMIINT